MRHTKCGFLGFADAARIGPDSKPVWDSDGPLCLRKCIQAVGVTAIANGLLCAADPDVTYAKPRGGLTEAEWRTWHSFVGLLGGMAMFSEPLHEPEYAQVLRHLEILNPPSPVRARSFQAATDPDHRQFGFFARRPWGNFAAVLLWNPDDTPAEALLDREELKAPGARFHVWSFWDETYLGIADREFLVRGIAPHGAALLRLTALPAEEDLPTLIGSNLHIAQGAAEIADVAASVTGLTITLSDGGARDGRLFVFSRRPLALRSVSGCLFTSVMEVQPSVWMISLQNRRRGAGQILRLSVIEQKECAVGNLFS